MLCWKSLSSAAVGAAGDAQNCGRPHPPQLLTSAGSKPPSWLAAGVLQEAPRPHPGAGGYLSPRVLAPSSSSHGKVSVRAPRGPCVGHSCHNESEGVLDGTTSPGAGPVGRREGLWPVTGVSQLLAPLPASQDGSIPRPLPHRAVALGGHM